MHFGDTLNPLTRFQRITVANDDELAIKGAVAIEEDEPGFVDEALAGVTRRAAGSRSR